MLIGVFVTLMGCGAPLETPPPNAMTPPQVAPTLPGRYVAEDAFEKLSFPDNRPVFREGADWLIAHPTDALPLLIAGLDPEEPEFQGVLRVLPLVPGREGAEALGKTYETSDDVIVLAVANALAKHPDPAALSALRRGANSPRRPQRDAALIALGARGDSTVCPEILGAIPDPDENTRFYAVRSGIQLGCLDEELRTQLASDPSQQVRDLLEASAVTP